MMHKLTTRFYYTVKDFIDGADVTIAPSFGSTIATLNGGPVTALAETTEINKLWDNYLWFSFQDEFIFFCDVETLPWEVAVEPALDSEEVTAAAKKWVAKLLRWVNETTERYIPLIQSYETIKSKLLDTINSENLVLYNDTPQNAGNWVADPYTTNATKTTTKQEIATPISRLDEIDNKLKSLYGEWARDFRHLIIWRQ